MGGKEIGPQNGVAHRGDPEGPLPTEMGREHLPKVLMIDPFAATRYEVQGRPRSMVDTGKTHSSAPESTKKGALLSAGHGN